ncbi:hypothetical protein [Bartonella sp. CB189]|uniref:hypothetical protein n=1 Tax=Bartonella sp. CB189 TaxID=3112254 RepID=UPI002F9676F5
MKIICHIFCLIIAAITLTSCDFLQYSRQNTSAGIDGIWVDENGIISSFHNGAFETRAADTEEKLSEGTYKYVSAQQVEIEIHSILRGTISRVSCVVLYNKTQLFCTSRNGLQFSLKRKI